MTVVTLRPDATIVNVGVAITGAATVHQALNDNSDGSYISSIGTDDTTTAGFAEPSLPAGAAMKSLALRARFNNTNVVGGVLSFYVFPDGGPGSYFAQRVISNSIVTTVTVLSAAHSTSPTALSVAVVGFPSSGGADARVYELYIDATYVAKPVASVTSPASRATITDTNLPVISWANTLDADGGGQVYYAVKVFTRAQVEAPGFVIGATEPVVATAPASVGWTVAGSTSSWQVPTPLADGDYVVYVAVAQVVNGQAHSSGWSSPSTFTIDVDLPGIPSIVVTPDDANGVHRIDVTCDTVDPTSTDLIEVEYSYDSRVTWAPLRTAEGDDGRATPASDAATLWDFEAPNGVVAFYRARALHNYSGVFAASDWVEDSGVWSSAQEWLVHPLDPSRSLRVTIHDHSERQRAARRGVFQALGSSTPITVTDSHSAETGTTSFQVEEDDRAEFRALVESGTILLLRGVSGSALDFPLYLSVGDLGRVEGVGKGFADWTIENLAWVRARRPAGGLLTIPA